MSVPCKTIKSFNVHPPSLLYPSILYNAYQNKSVRVHSLWLNVAKLFLKTAEILQDNYQLSEELFGLRGRARAHVSGHLVCVLVALGRRPAHGIQCKEYNIHD